VRQVLADSPRVDSVGYSSGVLKWRGNAGLSLERQLWSAGWSMQYYDSYLVYTATASATTAQTARLNQGSDTIPRQLYHDLFFKFHLPSSSELMIGIANVLDCSPPILATSSLQGRGYSTYGDPRLRRFTVTFRKSFGL